MMLEANIQHFLPSEGFLEGKCCWWGRVQTPEPGVDECSPIHHQHSFIATSLVVGGFLLIFKLNSYLT